MGGAGLGPRALDQDGFVDLGVGQRGADVVVGLVERDETQPDRDLVTPPELARDAPVADVLVPREVRAGVPVRVEAHLAVAGRVAARGDTLGHLGDLVDDLGPDGGAPEAVVGDRHVPLVRQPRLDRHMAAVGVADRVGVVAHLLEQVVLVEPVDDGGAGIFAGHAHEGAGIVGGVVPAVVLGDRAVGAHHVDDRQVVAEPDLPVVGVVCRRDLQEAGCVLRLGIGGLGVGHHDVVVGDDGDLAADDGQPDRLAHERIGTGIVGVHGHGRVAEHRLGPGRRDRHVRGAIRERPVGERVPEVPHVALDLFHLDLVVGERRAGHGVPVDEAFAAIDQAVLEEPEEGVAHRGGAHLVHREAGAGVVGGRAHGGELVEDDPLVLVLPLLGAGDEGVAAHLQALHALRQQTLLDHGLGGDAGVIGAGHPERLGAEHPVVPDQHVLQRVVERVSEVQRRGDIGRRDDDGVGVGTVGDRGGVEYLGCLPPRADFGLGIGRDVRLRQLGGRRGWGGVAGAHCRSTLPGVTTGSDPLCVRCRACLGVRHLGLTPPVRRGYRMRSSSPPSKIGRMPLASSSASIASSLGRPSSDMAASQVARRRRASDEVLRKTRSSAIT